MKSAYSHSEQQLNHLEMFLEYGVYPWTYSDIPRHSMELRLFRLIEERPDAVCALFRQLGATSPVQKRIAGQVSESLIHRFLGLLAPRDARWIVAYIQQIRRIHAHHPLTTPDDHGQGTPFDSAQGR